MRRQVAVIAAIGGVSGIGGQGGNRDDPCSLYRRRRPGQTWSCRGLARPGGNLTGINFFIAELVAKRLELLRELVPGVIRVAVLVNPANPPNSETTLRDVRAAARAMGLQIQVVRASTGGEIDAAFAALVRERPEPSSSAATPSSMAGVSNWPPAACHGSLQHIQTVTLPKPAG